MLGSGEGSSRRPSMASIGKVDVSLFQIDVNAFCSFSARSARLSEGKGAWEERVEAPFHALISLVLLGLLSC